MALTKKDFPHRRLGIGAWESICPECYLTAARASTEADLEAGEDRHKCVSPFLQSLTGPATAE
jgi:hypothetical protein